MKLQTRSSLGRGMIRHTLMTGALISILLVSSITFIVWDFTSSYQHMSELEIAGEELERVKQAMIDQQTGQRGFALSRNESFLDPYYDGVSKYSESKSNIIDWLSDNEKFTVPVMNMLKTADEWQMIYGEPQVKLVRFNQTIPEKTLMDGKRWFDEFRVLNQFAETMVTNEYQRVRNQLKDTVVAALYVTAGVIVLLILISLRNITRRIRSITAPINALNRAVAEYTYRHFDVPVPYYGKQDELGQLIRRVDVMRSVLHEKFRQAESLAEVDALTGLYNRRAFDEEIAKCVQEAERTNTPFSLILFDIDFFKKLNDTYGHVEGDRALIHIAQTMLEQVEDNEFMARYGGEEFVVLLRACDEDGVYRYGEMLRSAVEINTLGPYQLTISVGVATWNGHSDGLELVEEADQALYRAKHKGRNRVESFRRFTVISSPSSASGSG
ncbi:sensor domain-containing diguanylate cyclase [Marinicrinis sediminis]|uniref:Diguanylate cyclase n=1 Tax=Marinicrinis sediminis TaxID=1652465 RepID=A0ABW5RG54_9BACL